MVFAVSAVGLVNRKHRVPGSVVFGSGTTTPFVIGKGGVSRPLVDGWYLERFEHDDYDCFKVTYDAIHYRSDRKVALNWSPYLHYTEAHFAAMVAMGFPKGVPCGLEGTSFRLYPTDVEALHAEYLAACSLKVRSVARAAWIAA